MTKNSKKILYLVLSVIFSILFFFYYFTFSSNISQNNFGLKSKNNKKWQENIYDDISNFGLIKSDEYLISTSDVRSSRIGQEILAKGGNVIDAVIAAQMVLGVVEPQSSGIGGGAFLLYYDAKTKKTQYFNGRESAPKNVHDKIFLDKDGHPKEFYEAVKGGLSVGTPALLKMLKSVHKKYGKLKWEDLFREAITFAKEGFVFNKRTHDLASDISYLKDFKGFSSIYLNKDGSPKKTGEVIKNTDLAKTLEIIAKEGIKPFYEGNIAKNIVNKIQNSKINPGYLSLDDLKEYKVKDGELICGPYREYKICSMPIPSSGGIALLQILGILENFNLSYYKPLSLEAIHIISQASRLAYSDRDKYLADVPNIPIKKMLSKDYLKSRSDLIKTDNIIRNLKPGKFSKLSANYLINNNSFENSSTTHISAIDKEGNAIVMTSSIEYAFGSALVVDGFILNNQLTDFSFLPKIDGKEVANKVSPSKQPRSSMTPTFVFDKDNKLILLIGSPGGKRIIQYVLKTIIAYLDWNLNIAHAVSLPNFIALDDVIELEKGSNLEILKPELENIGYKVKIKDIVSGINAIAIDPVTKELFGSADFRRNGAALGN